jgi:hypothetical protein
MENSKDKSVKQVTNFWHLRLSDLYYMFMTKAEDFENIGLRRNGLRVSGEFIIHSQHILGKFHYRLHT